MLPKVWQIARWILMVELILLLLSLNWIAFKVATDWCPRLWPQTVEILINAAAYR